MTSTEVKPRKTAASIRRILEDRLAAEEIDLAASWERVRLHELRIELITELLKTADSNGKEEGKNGD